MLGVLLWVLCAQAALADDGGRLRVAHLSPDTPAVDVAVAPVPAGSEQPLTDPGTDLVTDLSYGAVSEATALAPGTYAVSVRPAGGDRTRAPLLSTRLEVTAGATTTVTVAGRFADLALDARSEELSTPPPGSASVRVLAAAGTAGSIDAAVRGGPDLARALPFGAVGDRRVLPGGATTLTIGGSGVAPTEVTVTLAAGSVVTVLVLDGPGGGLTVRPVVDAAGPAVVPTGGVEAGTGGAPSPAPAVLAGAGAALAAVGRRARILLATIALTAAAGVVAPPAALATGSDAAGIVTGARGHPAPPLRLLVPRAGVDALLSGVALDAAGALVPPADPEVAGWYAGGPAPGTTGAAVVTGHVDWAGAPGVFARLADLVPGDAVRVVRADGSTADLTVTRVVHRAKSDFPTAEVYAPTSGTELRLITCGGAFDRSRRSYEDNVIVFAHATG